MTMIRIARLASMGLAFALALATLPARAETCTADSFGDAVDGSAAELRAFSAETQPKLRAKLQALRDNKGWTDADYETKGLKLVHDAQLDAYDAQAGELLSKIDSLGSPETSGEEASTDCSSLSELKTASSDLMAVMRAKSVYLIEKIDREIARSGPAKPAEVAKLEPEPAPTTTPVAEPKAVEPEVTEPKVTEPKAAEPKVAEAEPLPDLSPLRRTQPAQKDFPPPVTEPTPAPEPPPQAAAPEEPSTHDDRTSSWSTTTAQAVIPPPIVREPQADAPPPNYDAPPPGTPYELPPAEGEEGAAFDAEGGGYSIDEIREASRGFFGTISTSLASVIEYTFQKAGRPTAYVLGTEGGGAILAGLRYGEGTMYLRSGGSQKVYWHGPSIGYDVGGAGSRTLFLIYNLHEPDAVFRRFTGVDGSAYLVGGVGVTLLQGGDVTMAPIRSGLGLRIGASIGYVRFSPRPTWNPF
ncbi:EipA family protein [Hyphomicrobium sp. CS1GBMeth3]|uniref:EipA family protein n=1 Tax=Hyphomicrobium sp. CS1GBMeth3 TaxID=1892845 RepID=UPI000ADA891E|nr:EipA family protein [Hyphomicrobium sp. CS1GBMeth3]